MTDQPTQDNGTRLPAERPTAPPPAPAERFTAPPSARHFGLTSERAAQIVRQSGSARSVAFLSILVILVFLTAYYFYDTGVPGLVSGRQAAASQDLQVTSVANGYALFEANCARCHGAQGQGYIGPALNDQVKLSTHLSPQYIQNVLTAGGRYVCGDPNSIMPVWADTNGGPLNYQQIADIIAFIRAPKTVTFQGIDPATGQTVTLHGWRDPSYTLPANATPFPACWSKPGTAASGSPAASAAVSPGASGSGGNASGSIDLTAQGIQFQQTSLTAPANKAFTIVFHNNDTVLHNVVIKSSGGQQVFSGDLVQGPATKTYQVPALGAGTYSFFCAVHPNMTGTIDVK